MCSQATGGNNTLTYFKSIKKIPVLIFIRLAGLGKLKTSRLTKVCREVLTEKQINNSTKNAVFYARSSILGKIIYIKNKIQ